MPRLGAQDTATLTIDGGDSDRDGLSDAMEDGGPNDGDGDNNGTKDSEEGNVGTFLDINDNYLTLVSPAGTELADVKAMDNPSPEDTPSGATFPAGFFEFSVDGVPVGGCTEVTLLMARDPSINSYYKYGPTPDNPAEHWYEFLYDGQTGAEIFHEEDRTRIVLHLCDGERGDDDLDSTNGVIDDIGGPATVPSGDDGGGGGGGCFISAGTDLWAF